MTQSIICPSIQEIGCGIAGFKIDEMAPLFKGALELENVAFAEGVCDGIKEMDFIYNQTKKAQLAVLFLFICINETNYSL